MIVYFDTSALLKRYIAETDSDAVLNLWKDAALAVSSQLLYAEMIATFARKLREQPASAALIDAARQTFCDDWNTLYRISINDDVNRRVEALLARHALRGADSVHLASALLMRDLTADEVTFACADVALLKAARAEGLALAP